MAADTRHPLTTGPRPDTGAPPPHTDAAAPGGDGTAAAALTVLAEAGTTAAAAATAARAAPEPVLLADASVPYDVPQRLAAHSCWYPSVDPGGRNVAFICDRTGVPQLWTGPVDGDEPRLLDADPDPVTEVSWSPDGRWIAYTTAPGGGELTRVLCVRPDGTGRRLLAGGEPGASAYLGCWTHDGSAVAVTVTEPAPAGDVRARPDGPPPTTDLPAPPTPAAGPAATARRCCWAAGRSPPPPTRRRSGPWCRPTTPRRRARPPRERWPSTSSTRRARAHRNWSPERRGHRRCAHAP
ncbi:hypothetical protein [Streptomyces sp. 2231.1]|uniref:TolB family protein n=1 Tax=Streptomyces sp. 2231.1 TaxID=1855347 RepID=UPI000B2FD368|nr:hypothetical protein [Streptomyces sp. 2231.1]